MNEELPDNKKPLLSLEVRFAARPQVYARLHKLADLMDQAIAEGCTADEAESLAMEQIQKLGASCWATGPGSSRNAAWRRASRKTPPPLNTLKKVRWFTTFGPVAVVEQLLRLDRRGAELRPF